MVTTYAKLMLEQRDKSIKQTASELNFPEQFTFRKYFKQHVGISPKEYRNSHALKQKEKQTPYILSYYGGKAL